MRGEEVIRAGSWGGVVALLMLAACRSGGGAEEAPTTGGGDVIRSCSDFTCREDAQAWHEAHPEQGLDADGDGIVCKGLRSCSQSSRHPHASDDVIACGDPTPGAVVGDGWYLGETLEDGAQFDVLLEDDDPEPGGQVTTENIQGWVCWGDGTNECAEIVSGTIEGGVVQLVAVPVLFDFMPDGWSSPQSWGIGSLRVCLDTNSNAGSLRSSTRTRLLGAPDSGEFVVREVSESR